ncbi:unnamed protein product [Closterium sp. NIES-54]
MVESSRLYRRKHIHNVSYTVFSTATAPRTEKRTSGEDTVSCEDDAVDIGVRRNGDALDARFSTNSVGSAKNQAKKLRPSAGVPDHQRFLGVLRRRGGWAAVLRGVKIPLCMWLATFDTPEDTAFVHDITSLSINGARARLNFEWTRRYVARTADIGKRCAGTLDQDHKIAIHEDIVFVSYSIMAELPNLTMSEIHAKMSSAAITAGHGTIAMQKSVVVDAVKGPRQAAKGASAILMQSLPAEPVETRPWLDQVNNCKAPLSLTAISAKPQVFHDSRRFNISSAAAESGNARADRAGALVEPYPCTTVPEETHLPASPPARHHVARHRFSVTHASSSTLPTFPPSHPPCNTANAASPTHIPAELPKSLLIPVSGSAAGEAFAVEYTSAGGSSAGHASAGSMSAPIGAPSLAPPLPLSLQLPSPTIISSAFAPATPSSPRSSPLIPSACSNTPASASVPLAL